MAIRGKCCEVFHGAELRLDLTKVRNRIAAVRAPLGTCEQGHEVNVSHTCLFEIGKFFPHAAKISGEAIRVQHHAEHFIAAIPARTLLSLSVQGLEFLRTRFVHALEHGKKIPKGIFVIMVQFRIEPL